LASMAFKDSAAGRRDFSRCVEVQRLEEDAELRQTLKSGRRLGAEDFLDRLQDRLVSRSQRATRLRPAGNSGSPGAETHRRGTSQAKANPGGPCLPAKGASLKVKIAERLHRETPMIMRWIADALHMGTGVTCPAVPATLRQPISQIS
jgi:hypothetical protein